MSMLQKHDRLFKILQFPMKKAGLLNLRRKGAGQSEDKVIDN